MDHDHDLDKCYEVAMNLINEAGEIVALRNEGTKSFICKSGLTDLVTKTDKQVEEILVSGLSTNFPTHKFICEEDSSDGVKYLLTDTPTWIIDPVDGTMNFVHSFPHSCISVALLINKVTEIGIIFNPHLNQKFTARRGQGSFYNGRKMSVSGIKELTLALITTEFGTSRDPEKLKVVNENLEKMSRLAHAIRTLGSAALNMAMVALGAADANYEMGIHAWDVAAADLLVREAGGITIDPSGGPFDMMSRRVLVAATPELANEIVKTLTQFYPLPRDDEIQKK